MGYFEGLVIVVHINYNAAFKPTEDKQWMPQLSVQWPPSSGRSSAAPSAWRPPGSPKTPLNKRELIGKEIRKPEMLYGQFIHECSKLITDSFTRTLDTPLRSPFLTSSKILARQLPV